ncbi:UDP-diphosphatase, partial [Salmonella enterica subsp. enterica serovar Haifa]|nr:UDP-diphosphatase [Salmonella enterica subsp. enterica serovar Haifa]
MHLFEALILGIVQGLTEFLPISSSAHLRIIGTFLPSGEDPGAAFTAITQIGTEAAVVVFFWRDIVRIISQWFRSLVGKAPRNDPDARMGWLII